MSLHHIAHHMASKGRGPDTELVHMTKGEVAGLQSLARAHGGSLTVNPHTGLAEAGFLSNILPAVVGAAGMYFGVNPAITAGIMGLGTAANTGDLGKGLMAGLGAYGGGNMMNSAMSSGLVGATPQAVMDQVPQAAQLGAPEMIGTESATGNPIYSSGSVLNQSNPAAWADGTSVAGGTPINAQNLGGWGNIGMAAAPVVADLMSPNKQAPAGSTGMIRPYTFAANPQTPTNMVSSKFVPGQHVDTSERQWFNPQFTALTPYKAAEGGIVGLAAGGGPVEQMSNNNSVGANTQYPTADISQGAYATPWQTPISRNIISDGSDTGVNQFSGDVSGFAAGGGISSLGGYSDGGRMLKGPGDGMSDDIPAQIGDKQPARLADGEFVVPADVVSHLGNGSTDAGAKQLYSMMDKVRKARTGRKSQGKQIAAGKYLPA